MTNFITIAHNHGLELSAEAQSRFYKAVDYLLLYLDEHKKWPYQEISNMDYYRNRLTFELFRIFTCIDKSKSNYLRIYEVKGSIHDQDLNNLLFIK